MTAVEQGHGAERVWAERLELAGRWAGRPRWAVVDVISMKAGTPTYFDEVKTTAGGPYERFGPKERAKLLAEAEKAGAQARLIYWPDYKKKRNPRPVRIILSSKWPT